jgi:hypothetical protein
MAGSTESQRKRKVKWVQGDQNGKGVTVAPPSTMRLARRGISGRKHRRSPGR